MFGKIGRFFPTYWEQPLFFLQRIHSVLGQLTMPLLEAILSKIGFSSKRMLRLFEMALSLLLLITPAPLVAQSCMVSFLVEQSEDETDNHQDEKSSVHGGRGFVQTRHRSGSKINRNHSGTTSLTIAQVRFLRLAKPFFTIGVLPPGSGIHLTC